MTTEVLDIDQPKDARRYIEMARKSILPPETDRVQMGSGEWILLDEMTDEQAVRVARSVYLDIEIPAAKGARKQ